MKKFNFYFIFTLGVPLKFVVATYFERLRIEISLYEKHYHLNYQTLNLNGSLYILIFENYCCCKLIFLGFCVWLEFNSLQILFVPYFMKENWINFSAKKKSLSKVVKLYRVNFQQAILRRRYLFNSY